ncbi:unnamed protein product [Fraxinus pennsylvanica]|uniref:Uncharacterized protein n=1 Tax=Fraxinus pennsylvanica TaxID=56036 RepID=A0AAD2AAM0_9LAMI|nr:unnamed protein product [Fraxinus pennsylvanica]
MATSYLPGLGLREKQKEQDRERRRRRDRERRLSMSLEERERHLARRRRNYQLRRRKEEHAKFSQHGKASTTTKYEDSAVNDSLAPVHVSGSSVPSDAARHVGYIGQLENQIVPKSEGAEPKSHEIPKHSGRLRLNQIRHLARMMNSSESKPCGDCQQTTVNATIKENATTNCLTRKTMRLVHVKRLARGLNSPNGKATDQDNLSTIQGMIHPPSETVFSEMFPIYPSAECLRKWQPLIFDVFHFIYQDYGYKFAGNSQTMVLLVKKDVDMNMVH